MYTYIYMWACMYTYVHIHLDAHIHAYTHKKLHMHMHLCTYTHTSHLQTGISFRRKKHTYKKSDAEPTAQTSCGPSWVLRTITSRDIGWVMVLVIKPSQTE